MPHPWIYGMGIKYDFDLRCVAGLSVTKYLNECFTHIMTLEDLEY